MFLFFGLVMSIDPTSQVSYGEELSEGEFLAAFGFMGLIAFAIWWVHRLVHYSESGEQIQ